MLCPFCTIVMVRGFLSAVQNFVKKIDLDPKHKRVAVSRCVMCFLCKYSHPFSSMKSIFSCRLVKGKKTHPVCKGL